MCRGSLLPKTTFCLRKVNCYHFPDCPRRLQGVLDCLFNISLASVRTGNEGIQELSASFNAVRMLAWIRRLVSGFTTFQQTFMIT